MREDFVNYVVKALISNPDAVELKRVRDDKGEYLELHLDAADMGKVIGKAGATAKSIRTLLRGVGAKDGLAPLPLKIVDPEGGPSERNEAPAESQEATDADPAPAEEDEIATRHAQTKREAEELADLEL
ncbi:KH domain-containing protein [Patescibacteria group bacterium]|nr:MAG: KH domain-containing protein [Patescibacteria group bacterium]